MPALLTVGSLVTCMHGAPVLLTTDNDQLSVNGLPALLETDTHEVVGCPFVVGLVPSPCVLVTWDFGTQNLKVNEVGVLTEESIGQCQNAAGAPQGVAIVLLAELQTTAI